MVQKKIKESKDEDIRIPKKTGENVYQIKVLQGYNNETMLKNSGFRNGIEKWFSRSQMYQNIKNVILSPLPNSQTNIEFYQNPSVADPSYTLPGLFASPFLFT